eukprot:CAMPEP_0119570328 /NCGR_PEP_ID=MMETSP1352-20130426/43558_1 /TAXON_ID=265584 /ORGANISM="Stauroneis constricta, Strain CCMP1120" /LENGTH=334 /DNA_ID=CAMNT_0007619995 /DNA_START=349 /DNA_END=1353 /DNA_ORIENTATION=-
MNPMINPTDFPTTMSALHKNVAPCAGQHQQQHHHHLQRPQQQHQQPIRMPKYGGPTVIPQNDVARLSYYLKCCLFCMPSLFKSVPVVLFDYNNIESMPRAYHDAIYRLAFQHFTIEKLVQHNIIRIDDALPSNISNMFEDVHVISSLLEPEIKKTMACTPTWAREYFILPFYRYFFTSLLEPEIKKTMACTPTWAREYFILPFYRYFFTKSKLATATATSTSASASTPAPPTNASVSVQSHDGSVSSNIIPQAIATLQYLIQISTQNENNTSNSFTHPPQHENQQQQQQQEQLPPRQEPMTLEFRNFSQYAANAEIGSSDAVPMVDAGVPLHEI